MTDPRIDDRALALLPVREYLPGAPFTVVSRLPPSTSIEVLNGPDDSGVTVIPRPDEYYGYVVAWTPLGTTRYGLVFTRELLRAGGRYRLLGEATVFSARLGLLGVPFVPVDEADGGEEGGGEAGDGGDGESGEDGEDG